MTSHHVGDAERGERPGGMWISSISGRRDVCARCKLFQMPVALYDTTYHMPQCSNFLQLLYFCRVQERSVVPRAHASTGQPAFAADPQTIHPEGGAPVYLLALPAPSPPTSSPAARCLVSPGASISRRHLVVSNVDRTRNRQQPAPRRRGRTRVDDLDRAAASPPRRRQRRRRRRLHHRPSPRTTPPRTDGSAGRAACRPAAWAAPRPDIEGARHAGESAGPERETAEPDLGRDMADVMEASADAAALRCCCAAPACDALRHNRSVLDRVGKDVHAAARAGQVRLLLRLFLPLPLPLAFSCVFLSPWP